MTATHDGVIDLESGEYVPVGHIWKFDFDFANKSKFSKIRFDHVMLKFLATTEKWKLI